MHLSRHRKPCHLGGEAAAVSALSMGWELGLWAWLQAPPLWATLEKAMSTCPKQQLPDAPSLGHRTL